MEKANIKIGTGKAVHRGFKDGEEWFTSCGADHATNKGWARRTVTTNEVTCKKCLKQGAKK